MKLIHTVPAVVLGAALLAACGSEKKVSLETHLDKASYGIGLNIGGQMASEGVDINTDALALGIKDALSKAEPRIDQESIRAAFDKVREDQMAKQKEKQAKALEEEKALFEKHAKEEGVVVMDNGIHYQVLASGEEGAASPEAADTVKVHYHGTLTDGTVFDSSVERGEPAQFPLNGVIRGWTLALQEMKVGDKWKLLIPSKLAYGERSPSPAIPANSPLYFEVELLEIVEK